MIDPRCCFSICLPKIWLARNVPFKLISTTRSHSPSGSSARGIFVHAPEVTIRMSTRPKFSTTVSHKRCRLGRSCTSLVSRSVREPMASNSAAVAFTLFWSRLLTMVVAPASAKPCAIASPIPLVPPSTTATRSFKENISSAFIRVKFNFITRLS